MDQVKEQSLTIIDNKIYDFHDWASKHPGGADKIIANYGGNATAFYLEHHSLDKLREYPLYERGVLSGSSSTSGGGMGPPPVGGSAGAGSPSSGSSSASGGGMGPPPVGGSAGSGSPSSGSSSASGGGMEPPPVGGSGDSGSSSSGSSSTSGDGMGGGQVGGQGSSIPNVTPPPGGSGNSAASSRPASTRNPLGSLPMQPAPTLSRLGQVLISSSCKEYPSVLLFAIISVFTPMFLQ
jgi:hypothetical protein